MVGTEGKSFEIKACRSLENAFLLNFSWNFKVYGEFWKKVDEDDTFHFACL